jgi:hypothetical protein
MAEGKTFCLQNATGSEAISQREKQSEHGFERLATNHSIANTPFAHSARSLSNIILDIQPKKKIQVLMRIPRPLIDLRLVLLDAEVFPQIFCVSLPGSRIKVHVGANTCLSEAMRTTSWVCDHDFLPAQFESI